MDDWIRLMTLQDANTRVVLVGTTLLGIVCGVVGVFAVMRRRALVADAVAHAALPGVCAAFLFFGTKSMPLLLAGALVFGALAAAFVSGVQRLSRVKDDAAIALGIGGFFGLGIVLSRIAQNAPSGNQAGLDGFIFGKAASMVASDAWLIAIVATLTLLAVLAIYKELAALCFDEMFARGIGRPTGMLDLGLMGMVCACVVAGLPAVGVVLVVAMLVIPATAARFWTDRLGVVVAIAGVIGGAAAFIGTVLSATMPAPAGALSRGWPTGPLIVLVAAALFAFSMLAAPKRGLIADAARRVRLRRRMAMHHLLRDAYELVEAGSELRGRWSPDQLLRRPHAGAVRRALASGLIERQGGQCAFTSTGLAAARDVVRTHRLWELFLIEQARIAADHVDRDADDIEHVLPPELITSLEAKLRADGRLPESNLEEPSVPQSPHPIGSRVSRALLPLIASGAMLLGAPASIMRSVEAATTESASLTALAHASNARALVVQVVGEAKDGAVFHLGTYGVTSIDLWTVSTAVCCSVACALPGCFLVLRRMSLVGDAISHAVLPGLAAAFLISGSREPLVMLGGATCAGLLTAGLSASLHRWGRMNADAATGVVFTTLFAVGVILITFAARSVDLDPGCVLYGLLELAAFDTVRVFGADVPRAFVWLGIALIINAASIAMFYKELRITCFDPALATAMGINALIVQGGLMALVAATSVAAFDAVGSILVIAMLVGPAATAQLLTDRLGGMLAWAAVVASVSSVIGYVLAIVWNTSIAGMMATVVLAVFVCVLVIAPRHGLVGRVLQTRGSATSPR